VETRANKNAGFQGRDGACAGHIGRPWPVFSWRDASLCLRPEARLIDVRAWRESSGALSLADRIVGNALTVIVVHGLEGSSDSRYMLGIAAKGLALGMNVVRMNQRNCGGHNPAERPPCVSARRMVPPQWR